MSENFSKAIDLRIRKPNAGDDHQYELQRAIALIKLGRQEDVDEISRLAGLLGEGERKTEDYAEVEKWLGGYPKQE